MIVLCNKRSRLGILLSGVGDFLMVTNPAFGWIVVSKNHNEEIITKKGWDVNKGLTNGEGGGRIKIRIKEKELSMAVKKTIINKHVFVWVGAFLFGGIGLDRFLRGQVGTGICKLLFSWLTLGIWELVDFIIAVVKAYGGSYPGDKIEFINGGYSK